MLMFPDGGAVGAPRLPPAGGPRAGARERHQAADPHHLRLPGNSLRAAGFGRHGAALRRGRRLQTQGGLRRPPMND